MSSLGSWGWQRRTPPVPALIERMFAELASVYDRSNMLLSFGLHRWWRWQAVRYAGAASGMAVLDCATGTGDFAFAFWRRIRPTGRLVGVDFCKPMLERARTKAQRMGIPAEWVWADVLQLPFAEGTFDIAAIAFGIRNVADPVACVREMARVTRPGGRIVVLELGQPVLPLLRPLYWLYSRYWIPLFGRLFAGKGQAYEYLHASAWSFPCGEAFVELMRRSGAVEAVRAIPLSGGIAWCYVATVGRRA